MTAFCALRSSTAIRTDTNLPAAEPEEDAGGWMDVSPGEIVRQAEALKAALFPAQRSNMVATGSTTPVSARTANTNRTQALSAAGARSMPTEPDKPIIFISYAHADEPENPAPEEVKWLSFGTGYLRPAVKRGAVDIWIDRLLRGGDDWDPEIERKLRACNIFIVLVSRHSHGGLPGCRSDRL